MHCCLPCILNFNGNLCQTSCNDDSSPTAARLSPYKDDFWLKPLTCPMQPFRSIWPCAGTTMFKLKILDECNSQSPVTPDSPALYSHSNMSTSLRSHISRLPTGTFATELEIERQRNIPANERFCNYWTAEEVKNEFHLLFTCSLYQQLRNQFNMADVGNKFYNLQSALSNEHGCRQLANYLICHRNLRIHVHYCYDYTQVLCNSIENFFMRHCLINLHCMMGTTAFEL